MCFHSFLEALPLNNQWTRLEVIICFYFSVTMAPFLHCNCNPQNGPCPFEIVPESVNILTIYLNFVFEKNFSKYRKKCARMELWTLKLRLKALPKPVWCLKVNYWFIEFCICDDNNLRFLLKKIILRFHADGICLARRWFNCHWHF